MRVAITGGTGTLGRALIPRLLKDGAERVVSVSRDEVKADELVAEFDHPNLRVFLGDVRDEKALTKAFYGCDTVIHAAALKRVTSGYSAREVIKTNIEGTMNVVDAAETAGCERLLFISSDKAVHATNLYGTSKYTAETYAIQANSYTYPRGLRVSCTRYGNVLGSRGSVTEMWAKIPESLPIPITSAAMTRFMITKQQAVDFCLYALDTMLGGEVFIPCLPTFSIIELAMAIYGDRMVNFTGLRDGGEKLHESLVSSEEWARLYWADPGKTAMVMPSFRTWNTLEHDHQPVLHANEFRFRSDMAPRLTLEELEAVCQEHL